MTRPLGKVCEEVCLAGLSRKTRVRAAVLLAALLTPILGFAQNDNWLGGTGLWSDGTKWSLGAAPTSSNNVFIDNGKSGASPVTINFNGAQCGSLTVDNDDSLIMVDGTIFTLYGPTIGNAGNIFLNSAGFGTYFNFGGAVTLSGAGTLTMSNDSGNYLMGYAQPSPGASLTNMSTIQGAGNIGFTGGIGAGNSFINQNQATVNANQTTPLLINVGSGTVSNTGKLEATSGATLQLWNGAITNTGGIIHADPASIVSLYNITISGGTLTTSGTGTIEAVCCLGYSTLDGVTLSGTGTFQWVSNNIGYLHGTITNDSAMKLTAPSGTNVVLDVNGAVTLKGSGTLTSTNPNNAIMGYAQASGASLLNQSTIQGTVGISAQGGNTITNQGTIYANQASPLTIATGGGGTFTNAGTLNAGTLKVKKGSALYVTGAGFTNFSGGTFSLTGGKYAVSGTLGFDGANISTNAADITLTGAASQIINDQNSANALTNFATNTTAGSFSLLSGKLINTSVTSGNFSNAGKVTVGVGSGFQISAPSPLTPTYTQTAGTTTVDGVLTAAGGVTIKAGKVFGKGTIASTVVSSGSVTAGDSTTKAGKLSMSTYTQNSSGSLNVQIGGLTAGTQYSQLAVANGVSLNGTLNIKVVNGFIPANGNTFIILTGSTRSGTFAHVHGLTIPTGGHFTVAYNPTNVTLTVGP
jgi:fibronectin-binding autotransporter adhesin